MNILVYGMDFRDFVRKKYTNHSIRFKSIVSFKQFSYTFINKRKKMESTIIYVYIYIYGYSIIEMHDRYYEKSREKVGRGSRIRNYDFDRNGHVDRTWVSFMKVARRSRRWRQLW